MKKVTIHTDGGCHGNPGPGGWAAILRFGEHQKEISGSAPATTNNRMELQAAIAALNSLKQPCEVEFFTDSEYLRNGIGKWIHAWKARGWKTASKAPVKNADLWRELDGLVGRHRVAWRWVRGHNGDPLNERCDQLATEAIAALTGRISSEQLKSALQEFVAQNEGASGEPSLL